jgi:hypothetical protein
MSGVSCFETSALLLYLPFIGLKQVECYKGERYTVCRKMIEPLFPWARRLSGCFLIETTPTMSRPLFRNSTLRISKKGTNRRLSEIVTTS